MDYLKDDEALPVRPAPNPGTGANEDADLATRSADRDNSDVDPLLTDLIPTDRNVRRRVISALLRGVLLDGGRGA